MTLNIETFEGQLVAKDCRVALVASRFNEFIVNKLIGGATDCFLRHQGELDHLKLFWAPGSFEIPLVAQKVANTKQFDAIVCLGAVIRGGTPHFDYVASEVAKGVAHVSLAQNLPILFGVLTTDSIEQAIERAGTKAGNKGFDAMMSALEMVHLCRNIESGNIIRNNN